MNYEAAKRLVIETAAKGSPVGFLEMEIKAIIHEAEKIMRGNAHLQLTSKAQVYALAKRIGRLTSNNASWRMLEGLPGAKRIPNIKRLLERANKGLLNAIRMVEKEARQGNTDNAAARQSWFLKNQVHGELVTALDLAKMLGQS